jgi:hypothetical protein
MRPIRPSGARGPWEPPAITKLAIGTETKSARDNGRSAGSETSDQPSSGQAQPPNAPAMKLGFSFEWSIPLSARTE